MRLKCQRESLEGFYREAVPLLQKHKAEIAHFADIPLEVDLDTYRSADQADRLRIFTVRIDRGPSEAMTLIGYAVFFVAPNPHYKSSRQAVQDVLFLDPDHRKGATGIGLIRFAETELKREGVQVIYHHTKLAHPNLAGLLAHFGYQEIERVWVKRFA